MASAPRHDPADRPPAMPAWVKVLIAVLAAIIVAVVVLKLAGVGPDHGPGRHSAAPVSPQLVAAAPAAPLASPRA